MEETIYRTRLMNNLLPYINPVLDLGEVYRELVYLSMDEMSVNVEDAVENIEEGLSGSKKPALSSKLLDAFKGFKADDKYVCSECLEKCESKEDLLDHIVKEHGLTKEKLEIYERDSIGQKIASACQEEDWGQRSSSIWNLPTTAGEFLEIAIYFGFDNCNMTRSVFNFSDLRYVPKSFSELKELKKTAEIIRGEKFEYTKLVEEHQLEEDEEEVLLSIIASTVNYSSYDCFPSDDLNSCREMNDLKKAFNLRLIKDDGSNHGNKNLGIDDERLKDIFDNLSSKNLINPSLRYRRSRRRDKTNRISNYNVTKNVCSRLFNPFFTEQKYKEKTKTNNLFERKTDDRRSRRSDRSKSRGFLHDIKEKEEDTDKIPSITFDDVILPKGMLKRIDRLLLTDEQSDKLYDEWGFNDVIETGKGTIMLFTGPPGTGKTHTARAIANKLNKPIHQIDFADVVSCWLGKTGTNVKSAFQKCEKEDKVLLLDECDAILSKRGGGSSGGEKEMERVVNILLQKIEETGVTVIMTTNLSAKLDKALKRRIDLVLQFPYPDPDLRDLLWRKHIPNSIILNEDVDFCKLADKYKLTGGEIKNAVFNAAKTAVKEGSDKISMKHFEETAEEEEDKTSAMGYDLNDEDDDDDLSMFM